MIGSSSAVGTASKKLSSPNLSQSEALPSDHKGWKRERGLNEVRMGMLKASTPYAMKRFRSVLEMPPMGLMSALEQLRDQQIADIRVSLLNRGGRGREKGEDENQGTRTHSYFVRYPRRLSGTRIRRDSRSGKLRGTGREGQRCSPFIDVRATQDEQSPTPPSYERQQLRKHVRQHHPQPRLPAPHNSLHQSLRATSGT